MKSSTQHIRIEDYQYELPEERIAKYPLSERDSSKLLLFRNGRLSEDVFRNLPAYLPEGELVVFNNTKVIQASALSRILRPTISSHLPRPVVARGLAWWGI